MVENQPQSLKGLFDVVLSRTDTPGGYRCEECQVCSTSTKTYGFDEAKDIIAIQLLIFSHDQRHSKCGNIL